LQIQFFFSIKGQLILISDETGHAMFDDDDDDDDNKRKTDHSSPSAAEIKNKKLYLHSAIFLRGVHKDTPTFTLQQI
jgi:hypothetical protein